MTAKKIDKGAQVGASTALDSWNLCNDYLRDADERQCSLLLAREKSGKRRIQYLLRIHARLNKVRAHRERSELLQQSK